MFFEHNSFFITQLIKHIFTISVSVVGISGFRICSNKETFQ